MIKISVDEAAAFDMLAIVALKKNSDKAFMKLLSEIVDGISINKCDSILKSTEYRNLVDANKKVFDLVDQMNSGNDLSAIDVHNHNMKRYIAKTELQKKFFNSELEERKV
jgi:hypothetical protein